MKLRTLLGAALVALAPALANAPSYPARPIRLVVPFPPAGATDILSRELARHLSDRLKQQVVVDNRPGAGGTIGSDIVAKSAPDGYTIQMATSSTHSIGPSLNTKIPYNALTDFTTIAHVADSANVLVIAPNVKAANVTELIAVFRAQPGGYNVSVPEIDMLVDLSLQIEGALGSGLRVALFPRYRLRVGLGSARAERYREACSGWLASGKPCARVENAAHVTATEMQIRLKKSLRR